MNDETEALIERVLARRDAQWNDWLEKFAVSVHEDIARVERSVSANFEMLRGEVKSHRDRIAELEAVVFPHQDAQ